ncbi:hypothetical protein OB446_004935 [Paenibacillus alvei]|uniref:hypothetical protein n=1 Tax=Paenibacillus alvei TaxID=44250 RepID=UPI0002EEFAED|nr:hypothetical protein [Paenibacillus alvei]
MPSQQGSMTAFANHHPSVGMAADGESIGKITLHAIRYVYVMNAEGKWFPCPPM